MGVDPLARRLLIQARDDIDAVLDADDAARPCAHPEDQRVSIARMGDPDAFVCRACGTESHPNRVEIVEEPQ